MLLSRLSAVNNERDTFIRYTPLIIDSVQMEHVWIQPRTEEMEKTIWKFVDSSRTIHIDSRQCREKIC